jgi:hypothetical protein
MYNFFRKVELCNVYFGVKRRIAGLHLPTRLPSLTLDTGPATVSPVSISKHFLNILAFRASTVFSYCNVFVSPCTFALLRCPVFTAIGFDRISCEYSSASIFNIEVIIENSQNCRVS